MEKAARGRETGNTPDAGGRDGEMMSEPAPNGNHICDLQGYEYETLMNALRVSVFKCLLDEDFTAIWCNDYFFESTGYSKEEYVAKYRYNIRAYFADAADEYGRIAAMVKEAWTKGLPVFECVARMPRKGGTFLWIKVIGSFTSEVRNGIPVLYVVYTDVSDVIEQQELRKRLEERSEMLRAALDSAERANRAKSDFLSRMSHDIRTPMNAIIGMADIAAAHADNPAKIRDCLKKISFSSQHLLSLINDVLDMSQIESGKMVLNNDIMSLSDLLERVTAILQPHVEARRQRFTVRLRGVRHDRFRSDALRLRQVFINILSNAVKFTPDGGNIALEVEETGTADPAVSVLRCVFSDSGIGMAPEFIERIFDAFTRERDSRVDKTEGSGLGMAITKRIVDMLGGTLEVTSAVGKGTTFRISLPLRVVEPAPEEEAIPPRIPEPDREPAARDAADFPDFTGRRFLLVEDNGLNREIARELLSVAGAVVDCACDGAEGLAMFEKAPPALYDMVLMDVQMPVMNGYAATRAIRGLPREDARRVPILALTADAFASDIEAARNAGMDGHLAKPLDVATLYSEIARFLGRG